MVIINNVSDSEWRLILASLKSYKNDKVFNMWSGQRPKEILDKLIQKVEGFTANDSISAFEREYESKWAGKSE